MAPYKTTTTNTVLKPPPTTTISSPPPPPPPQEQQPHSSPTRPPTTTPKPLPPTTTTTNPPKPPPTTTTTPHPHPHPSSFPHPIIPTTTPPTTPIPTIPPPLKPPPPIPTTPTSPPQQFYSPPSSPPHLNTTTTNNREPHCTSKLYPNPSNHIPSSVSAILHRSKQRLYLPKVGVASRLAAASLALICIAVMAADSTEGWAGDSFYRYREYRYCITVNIITFLYSSFQIFAKLREMMMGKFVIRPPNNLYFDLFFDQVLAYLLISASSTASARNYGWIVSWGSDPFTVMMNASISMSYLTFATLAISSLISAHRLFSQQT